MDESITAGEECGALESVKAASEVYSPVSGTVVAKNEAVEAAPALINSSAMDEGWLFKVDDYHGILFHQCVASCYCTYLAVEKKNNYMC